MERISKHIRDLFDIKRQYTKVSKKWKNNGDLDWLQEFIVK